MMILPHRYPFLLVDRITELEPGRRSVGYKNVTANEAFFNGHFPENPVMPGVLMIEALAQLGGTAVILPHQIGRKTLYLAGIDKVRFRRPVFPGDRLMMETNVTQTKRNIGWVHGVAKVDDQLICEGDLMFSILAAPLGTGMDASILHV
jgi:3-hydroxyacyl-[acyl-carrier-protein] dehydratase